MKNILSISAMSALLLATSSCTFMNQIQNPDVIKGCYTQTGGHEIGSPDCKFVAGRAIGESKGFNLFCFIPLKAASETEAVANMYNNARQSGCKLEGESRIFANTAVERSQDCFILWGRPSIKVSGDVVQYMNKGERVKKD